MSLHRSDDGIGPEDHRVFRLYKICVCEGRQTLYHIFQWGCKRDLTKSLKVYLQEEKEMNSKDFKRHFNADMRKKIIENPSGDDFDITLLFVCIQTACTNLATVGDSAWSIGNDCKLESVCTSIKLFRNNLIHESEVGDDSKMNDLRKDFQDKLRKAIELAGQLYERQPAEVKNVVQAMNDSIEKIMNAPFASLNIDLYLKEIRDLRESQKKLVKEQAARELVYKYDSMSRVDPASFITGKERLQVKNVFTRLEVIKEQNNVSINTPVEYETLLTLTSEDGSKPVVTVVEGDAGAGKTTLTKLVLDDWSSLKTPGASRIFQGLETYDLVLYAKGRNKSVDSFLALLSVLMPHVYIQLPEDVLLGSVRQLNVLLIIDGLDELNDASKKLIDDIFDKHIPASTGMLSLLITTRPNMLHDLPSILQGQSTVHTKLMGVAREKREEFVQKLHDVMLEEKQSKQSTQDLVDYLKQSHTRLGEHYRLPLNLTLLTYLWAYDPKRVNLVTTATGLYIALHELTQERLTERLKSLPGLNCKNLPEDLEEFLQELYHVCLETLSSGNMQLSSESTAKLKDKCSSLGLSLYEMCAPFLVLEKEWTASGYKFDFFMPHKSIMEFYAAFRISRLLTVRKKTQPIKGLEEAGLTQEQKEQILQIVNKKDNQPPRKLIDIMSNLLPEYFKPEKLSDYQNMLLHLGGLLSHNHPDVLHQYAEELVDLLRRAKVKGTQWLDLVVETNCDDKMTALVAPQVSQQLVVRDGHTGAALKMFTYLPNNIPIAIILENEVHYIPQLDELLDEVSKRKCDVELLLKHQWKHGQYGTSDDLLNKLTKGAGNQTCKLSGFWGYLKCLANLPNTVTNLHFNIVDENHAKAICEEFATLNERLSLETIGVHVMRGVSPEELKPMPMVKPIHNECGSLWVSDMDDVEWACQVARNLLPKEGRYQSIRFPRSNLSQVKCSELLTKFKERDIKIVERGSFFFSSNTISDSQLVCLREKARQKLDSKYCKISRCEEFDMW